MDAFFNTLKKGLVAMLFVVVGFAMTYVPQLPTSQVPEAHANSVTGGATLPMQVVQNASALAGNAINTITAGAVSSNWIKENVLDGIGWAIAKRIVSGMVRSLINWVNSGFQGSPAFLSDIKGFLLNIVDEEIGRVISEMGDIGSFICSPFRLDVQISIATQYAQGRAGQTAPTCTLSGVIDNIEGFIAGTDPGNGLSDWLTITSAPQTYTPYGAVLNAEVSARARLINAKGETLTEVNWGDGFLSQKICETVGGDSGGQQCTISKPGRVIADQLNKALGAGQDSLIQADELNELIAALLGQLANQALTGVAGLLGLSGGTGYTYSDYDGSYLDQLVAEADARVTDSGNSGAGSGITGQIGTQASYRDLLVAYQAELIDFTTIPDLPPTPELEEGEELPEDGPTQEEYDARDRQVESNGSALAELANINTQIATIDQNIVRLVDLAREYNADGTTPERRAEILIAQNNIPTVDSSQIAAERSRLAGLASQVSITPPTVERTSSLPQLLSDVGYAGTVDPADPAWISISTGTGLTLQ